MADETGANGAGDQPVAGGDAMPQVGVILQYVKDYSFENPNAPRSLSPIVATSCP